LARAVKQNIVQNLADFVACSNTMYNEFAV